MDPSLSSLLAALDQAHAADNEPRLLSLLQANLARFPGTPSLRRYAWRSALQRGDVGGCAAIMERTLELELAAGSLLNAVAVQRAAENAGIELRSGWQEILAQLSTRGFGENPGASSLEHNDDALLEGLPPADADVVYALAAAEPASRSERPRFAPVPWFSALDAASLRLSLPLLDGARIDPGTRFAVAETPPAWLVVGDLRDDHGDNIPPGAALVGERHGNVTAWSTCWLVTFPSQSWDELVREQPGATAWRHMQLRRRLLRTLQSLPILALHGDDGLQDALVTSELATWPAGWITLPQAGRARYVAFLEGEVQVLSEQGDAVAAYRAGDAVELRSLDGLRLRSQGPLETATFDLGEAVDEELLSGELQMVDGPL